MSTEDMSRQTRRMMATAIHRLNALEFVILGVAMVFSMVAGWISAWLLEIMIEAPFRISWTVSSLLFFVVPGSIVLGREHKEKRIRTVATHEISTEQGDDGRR
jgi:uncharacterized membrane protein